MMTASIEMICRPNDASASFVFALILLCIDYCNSVLIGPMQPVLATLQVDIANEFACHFSSVFYKSSNDILSCDKYKCKCVDIHYITNTAQCNISANASL